MIYITIGTTEMFPYKVYQLFVFIMKVCLFGNF